MTERHDDVYVGGVWRASNSGRRTPVVNPATEEVWAEVADGDAADVDAAVTAARAALPAWRATSPAERAELLMSIADALDAHAAELSRLITTENGTPVAESRGAPPQAAAMFRQTALLAPLLTDDVRSNPLSAGRSVVRRRPVGVAGLITPWNFPLSLIAIKLGPALLAGCTVVLKPAPETPMAARRFVDLLAGAGIPPGVVNLVTGGTEPGEALVQHPGVDKISFTGSTAVGRHIGEVSGRMLRPVTLELGGKSPAIVLDDADPATVAANVLKVTMRNTGQTCKACTRLLVPASRHDEFVDLVAGVVAGAPIGDPFDPATFFGPLVSARQRDRVLGYVDIGRSAGAKTVVGGGVPVGIERGFFVEGTVFAGVDPSMRIAREEIFGPVLAVIPYRDVDDAVAIANDSEFGLAATVFGADEERATAVADRLDTGTIGINHYGSSPAAPFGGVKASGLGTELGPEGLEEYLTYTSVHYQL